MNQEEREVEQAFRKMSDAEIQHVMQRHEITPEQVGRAVQRVWVTNVIDLLDSRGRHFTAWLLNRFLRTL